MPQRDCSTLHLCISVLQIPQQHCFNSVFVERWRLIDVSPSTSRQPILPSLEPKARHSPSFPLGVNGPMNDLPSLAPVNPLGAYSKSYLDGHKQSSYIHIVSIHHIYREQAGWHSGGHGSTHVCAPTTREHSSTRVLVWEMTSKHGKHNPCVRLLTINQMLKLQCRDPYLNDGRPCLLSRYLSPLEGSFFNILIVSQLPLFPALDSML